MLILLERLAYTLTEVISIEINNFFKSTTEEKKKEMFNKLLVEILSNKSK